MQYFKELQFPTYYKPLNFFEKNDLTINQNRYQEEEGLKLKFEWMEESRFEVSDLWLSDDVTDHHLHPQGDCHYLQQQTLRECQENAPENSQDYLISNVYGEQIDLEDQRTMKSELSRVSSPNTPDLSSRQQNRTEQGDTLTGTWQNGQNGERISISIKSHSLLVEDLFQLKTNNRKDLVFKGIMRDMRRFFKSQFTSLTEYHLKKRRKGPQFFLDNLDVYIQGVKKELKKKNLCKENIDHSDMRMLLGSMFYPKDLIKSSTNEKARQEILQIKKGLETFSIGKMELFDQFSSFKLIMRLYLNAIEERDQFYKYDGDYNVAIEQLKKYYYGDE